MLLSSHVLPFASLSPKRANPAITATGNEIPRTISRKSTWIGMDDWGGEELWLVSIGLFAPVKTSGSLLSEDALWDKRSIFFSFFSSSISLSLAVTHTQNA